ncbi:MAG: Nre family DNA repair protein [Nitrososphaeria archaeon]
MDWLDQIVPEDVKRKLEHSGISVKGKFSSICIYCRGGRNLCGKVVCPITLKAAAMIKVSRPFNSNSVSGSSPPSLFVGRFGYPKVSVGPMVPPILGDTLLMDLPEEWIGVPIEQIVDYRYSLLRGKTQAKVTDVHVGNRVIESLHELAMSSRPVDSEVEFTRRPSGTIYLDDHSQPFGPSAPMKSFRLQNVTVNRKIEKLYYDTDLLSKDAVIELYNSGVEVSKIQKAFSVGMFGIERNRKLVPTRWSITAVDSIISTNLIRKVKAYEFVDKFYLYHYNYMNNIFASLLFPENWSFEWMEAWFPGTFWNQTFSEADVGGDYESYLGRTAYPSIGGCYFSARLAATEALNRMRRQATVLILREIHPEFLLPLGVWFVRECVRNLFHQRPKSYEDIESALKGLSEVMTVPLNKWIPKSEILRSIAFQRKITDFWKHPLQ